MTELHPQNREISMIYSPKYWLGVGAINMSMPDKFDVTTAQVGWLAHRWNLAEAQGNLYFVGGLGYGHTKSAPQTIENSGAVYRMGVQADFETRRIYTFARFIEHRFVDGNQRVNNQLSAAIGFAPYLGEFDGLNSWVIFKYIGTNDFQQAIYLPMMRFFYKNFLWEIGQDLSGNSQLNFMVRF